MTPVQTQAKGTLSAFAIRTLTRIVHLFGPWNLSFLRCLPAAVGSLPSPFKNKWQPTKRIVRTLTIQNAAGGGATYGKELSDFRKIIFFYKTNHSSFALPVHRPSPFVRTSKKTTKRILPSLGPNVVEAAALRVKKTFSTPENKSFPQNEPVCSQAGCV
jgi:hypothetical protein